MTAKKDSEKSTEKDSSEVVLAPFAYARVKGSSEVVQLVKGDIITDRFAKDSIDHLRSIGFVGDQS